MPRYKQIDDQVIQLTPDEEADEDAKAAAWGVELLDRNRIEKYQAADSQFVIRALAIHGLTINARGKVRGSDPQDTLNAWQQHRRGKGDARAAQVDTLFEVKLDALKTLIEAAADQTAIDAIDVTADIHWT